MYIRAYCAIVITPIEPNFPDLCAGYRRCGDASRWRSDVTAMGEWRHRSLWKEDAESETPRWEVGFNNRTRHGKRKTRNAMQLGLGFIKGKKNCVIQCYYYCWMTRETIPRCFLVINTIYWLAIATNSGDCKRDRKQTTGVNTMWGKKKRGWR